MFIQNPKEEHVFNNINNNNNNNNYLAIVIPLKYFIFIFCLTDIYDD